MKRPLAWACLLATFVSVACGTEVAQRLTAPSPAPIALTAQSATNVLVGSGDIADCRYQFDEETALLLDRIGGTVFTAGDNAYESGSTRDYAECYAPSWGRHKDRTRPSPGNHEYYTPGAADYFEYFGANAGPAGRGYYSYNIEGWHILSLNSNVAAGVGSAQYNWVKADLLANQTQCSAAYWHYPLFSSGYDGSMPHMKAIWALLQEFGVEFVVAGHAHNYERFAPQDSEGRPDPKRGIRQFVAGAAGSPLTGLRGIQPNSETFNTTVFGVVKFTLDPDSYSWEFIPVTKPAFVDSGSAKCF